MSVHISFQLVGINPVQSSKASEAPVAMAASFGDVLSGASDVKAAAPIQSVPESTATKKPQKKADYAKASDGDAPEGSVTALLPAQGPTPMAIPVAAQAGVAPRASTQGHEDVVDAPVSGGFERPMPQLATSDMATLPGTSELPAHEEARDARLVDASQSTDVGSGEVAAGSGEDVQGSAVSGALLARSDESSAPETGVASVLQLIGGAAQGGDTSAIVSGQTGIAKTDLTTDPKTVPVSVPVAPDASVQAGAGAQQGSVPNTSAAMDLSVVTVPNRGMAVGADGSVSAAPKTTSLAGKEHAAAEMRGRRKDEALDAGANTTVAGPDVPFKPLQAVNGPTRHDAENMPESKDIPSLQVQANVPSTLSTDAPSATHTSATAQSTEVPAQAQKELPGAVEAHSMPEMSGARLIQSVHQSEMKLGMNSAEFGTISISTSVTHQALSAQISLDHAELGRVLAAHLPAMEERLGNAYGLQAKVELRDGGSGSSSSSSQHSDERGQKGQGGQTGSAGTGSFLPGTTVGGKRSSIPINADTERLDIRI